MSDSIKAYERLKFLEVIARTQRDLGYLSEPTRCYRDYSLGELFSAETLALLAQASELLDRAVSTLDNPAPAP